MRFKTADIDTYLQSKDYVDTAVIPLVESTWAADAKTVAQAVEFTQALTDEMERQFKGRIMQFPLFGYAKSENREQVVERLMLWQKDLKENGFNHIFLVTADANWKQLENELSHMTLLFVPALPLEYIEQKNRKKVMDGQLQQLLPIITAVWQEKV